jgi:hypothetical protein
MARVFRRSIAELLMIGADAPTFRADFGSPLALITRMGYGYQSGIEIDQP